MAVYLSPIGQQQVFDSNGVPLVGGYWETFLAGTTTPRTTYTSNTGLTAQPSQIVLDASGRPANPIWITGGVPLKFRLSDSNGVVLLTLDNISGINDPSAVSTTDQWIVYSGTPTYISGTSFSLPGDQTARFHVGRRIKTTNTGGVRYGSIYSSSYSSVTTITVTMDSGTLDSGLSDVSYGLVSAVNSSIPDLYALKGANANITSTTGLQTLSYGGHEAIRLTTDGDVTFGGVSTASHTGVTVPYGWTVGFQYGSGESIANVFAQANTVSTVLASGLKYSATANAFASARNASWGHSALQVGGGQISLYVNNASTAAVGADVAMAEQSRWNTNGAVYSRVPDYTGMYPEFKCRAWVNFNGTGSVYKRASGNVSSITDNGVGDYTLNFVTPMPDTNYCVLATCLTLAVGDTRRVIGVAGAEASGPTGMTTSEVRVNVGNAASASLIDNAMVSVAIFR